MKFFVSFSLVFLCGSLAPVFGGWVTSPPFYGQHYADATGVRGLLIDPAFDLLALVRGVQGIQVLYEEPNEDGTVTVVQTKIIDGAGLSLNHGLAYRDGYLYASSATAVYRWPFTPGSHEVVTTAAEMVIDNMPNGGHNTRSLIFDLDGRLYVSVGSNANVDNNSDRARIRRFNIAGLLPIPFNTGEVFADGLRNEVGLGWNTNFVLYGVENGADELVRDDLGGDIHNGNPAEEMNRFDKPAGQHYGYPYCFSTHNLEGYPAGTQFTWPTFMGDGTHDDEWCRNTTNNQPPAIPMPAHMAPLGIEFFRGQSCISGRGAFPCSMIGDAVVAFHGSWNSDVKVGRKVTMFPFEEEIPTGESIDIISDEDVVNCQQCFRPVNAVFSSSGHLFVSDDANGHIIKVTYGTPATPIKNLER